MSRAVIPRQELHCMSRPVSRLVVLSGLGRSRSNRSLVLWQLYDSH